MPADAELALGVVSANYLPVGIQATSYNQQGRIILK